jgi:LysM repeat protein
MIKELVWAGIALLQPQAQRDSIGVETVNGKVFVIHKVSEKETLYAISRRYGTTVDAIVQYNPTAKTGLDVGRILKVPYTAPATTRKTTPAPASGGGGIIHVVTAGETIFSIAKAYSVSVDDIKQWNNLSDNAISPGRELTIKRRGTAVNTTPPATTTPSTPSPISRKGTHTVAAKETMFSIARQYNISVDQLKEWNSLANTSLSIGQVLVVAQPERNAQTRPDNTAVVKTTPTPVTKTPESSTPVHQPTQTSSTPPATTTPAPVATREPATQTQTIRISESTRNSDEVLESGMAELIEGTEGNRKYLALHRTAPVGTILKIKNEMNNREVFVRVLGKLPEGATNDDKVVIRISKSAYDRLGAIDPRFRVQVTYYK